MPEAKYHAHLYVQMGEEPPKGVVQVSARDLWFDINNPGYSYQTHETHRPAKDPTEAQLKSAKRAMHSFVRKFPEYGVMAPKGGRATSTSTSAATR